MADNQPDKGAGPVPPPAHPYQRREPLPVQRPKSAEEDAEAPRRVKVILDSPSYRQADCDADFLELDETRGVRLQIDYLKPEFYLRQHGIEHTVVVFGSTRIPEPVEARRRVATLQAEAEARPGDSTAKRRLAIAERVLAKSHYYDVAREFGRLVGASAAHGRNSRIVLMTGGGPGIMEAANRGAFDGGAESIGLNITLPHEQYPNPYITPSLCFRFHYFALRKLHFLLRARALVAFPGGFGTFDELFEILTLVQTRVTRPVPIVLVGEQYWKQAFDPAFLAAEGVIDEEDLDLFWYAETAEEIWRGILGWHEKNGTPLGAASERIAEGAPGP